MFDRATCEQAYERLANAEEETQRPGRDETEKRRYEGPKSLEDQINDNRNGSACHLGTLHRRDRIRYRLRAKWNDG